MGRKFKTGIYVSPKGFVTYNVGKNRKKYIHRVMWEEKYGKIPHGYLVKHINDNKSDNRIENLELLSKSEFLKRLKRTKVNRNNFEEMGKLYLEGITTEELGKKFGVNRHTIYKYLKKLGVKKEVKIKEPKKKRIKKVIVEFDGRYCKTCGKLIMRKKFIRKNRTRGWKWEGENSFKRRKYCNHKCCNAGSNNPMFGKDRKKTWQWYLENGKYIKFYQCEEWRIKVKEIYKRDNYTCQMCKRSINELRKLKLKLNCHHVVHRKNGGELFENSNLVTLCEYCHSLLHKDIPLFNKFRTKDAIQKYAG